MSKFRCNNWRLHDFVFIVDCLKHPHFDLFNHNKLSHESTIPHLKSKTIFF